MSEGISPRLLSLGRRIREAREGKGLNQKDFAALGGVGVTSQQTYEAGKTAPTAEYFYRLEEQGIDIVLLLTGRSADRNRSVEETKLNEIYGRLSARERNAVMALALSLSGDMMNDAMNELARIQSGLIAGAIGALVPGHPDHRRLNSIAANYALPENVRSRAKELLRNAF